MAATACALLRRTDPSLPWCVYREMRFAAAVLVVLVPLASSSVAAQTRSLPVVFHVATTGGEPVMSAEEADAWLEIANEHFREADIHLVRDALRPLPEGHAELADIRARRRLSRFLEPRRINVFVVDSNPRPTPISRDRARRRGPGLRAQRTARRCAHPRRWPRPRDLHHRPPWIRPADPHPRARSLLQRASSPRPGEHHELRPRSAPLRRATNPRLPLPRAPLPSRGDASRRELVAR